MASRAPSSPSNPAQRPDREAAARVLTLSARGTADDQLAALLERSFHAALLEFIRFFSNRYAPVGAANDPNGLSQHHARNLIRLYAQAASTSG
jgi:hypothetical protein